MKLNPKLTQYGISTVIVKKIDLFIVILPKQTLNHQTIQSPNKSMLSDIIVPKYKIWKGGVIFFHSFDKSYYSVMRNTSVVIFSNNLTLNSNCPIKLPSHIKVLTLGDSINNPFVLPPYIEVLTLGYDFNQPIVLQPYLKTVIFGGTFEQPVELTKRIEKLVFKSNFNFNHPINLSKFLRNLEFTAGYEQPVELPKNIKILHISFRSDQRVGLPKYLKRLTVVGDSDEITLTPHIEYFTLMHWCAQNWSIVDNLPHSIYDITLIDSCIGSLLHNIPSNAELLEK